ncbi:mechanosensitive ion channel family protein [Pontiella sulfatireligans]|uniref:Low conductance mechanosensitive channel YnaI n=1 Tax=Pontiella sulfatireligans TaxID=2750658 RepID=A0A6C2UU24_9BACT|nr:mechanosensitive ion channel family protein [Pontiella sulfatireligans]VGO23463.1 Low conductance mechanosensitive channel YnaI [Pontiella sulfatireligans]
MIQWFSRDFRIAVLLLLTASSSMVCARDIVEYALEPMDLSSPRATLDNFLTTADAALVLMRDEYWENPTPAVAERLHAQSTEGARALDLSEIPPAARYEFGRDGYLYLYEVLSRIELPPEEEIPDASEYPDLEDNTDGLDVSWTIPHTEITLIRQKDGPRKGDFLFSPATVARAEEFYKKTRALSYRRDVPVENYAEMRTYLSPAGWMVSTKTINSFPDWLKRGVYDQAVWKWIAVLLLLVVNVLVIMGVHWISRKRFAGSSVKTYLFRLATPIMLGWLTPVLINLAIRQLTLTGNVSGFFVLVGEFVRYFSLAWIIWVGSMVVAELIIASPKIGDQSLNAHLLRLVARTLGIVSVFVIAFQVSNRLGAPLYSLVAGLGVGGIAIALAAQNTIENFIGSLNLFADKPVRVGDFCRYGEDPSDQWKRAGTVESIGLRSTRIRGIDNTVTTIPNGEFSRMHIVNFSRSSHRFLLNVLKLRHETTEEQLRHVLDELRSMLKEHPRVMDEDPRVRFIGFNDYALNVEIRADVNTTNFIEFRTIREDIFMRIMKIIKDAGTGFARPSRTVYNTMDAGINSECWQAEKEPNEE